MDHHAGYSNDVGVATVLAAMAVMNTEAIAKAIDPEGRAKVMQQGADETKLALLAHEVWGGLGRAIFRSAERARRS